MRAPVDQTIINDRKGVDASEGQKVSQRWGRFGAVKRFHWRGGSVRATKRFRRMGAEQSAPVSQNWDSAVRAAKGFTGWGLNSQSVQRFHTTRVDQSEWQSFTG